MSGYACLTRLIGTVPVALEPHPDSAYADNTAMKPFVLGAKQIPLLYEAGFFLVDYGDGAGFVSRALDALGFTAEQMRNNGYHSRIHPADLDRYLATWQAFNRGGSDELFCEYRVRDSVGAWHWIQTNAVVVERAADGSLLKVLGTDWNVTARKEADSSLRRTVSDLERDALTGFLTRKAFERDAAELWRATANLPNADPGSCRSVAVIDIDKFKQVNDRYGHAIGDDLIRRIAAEIRSQVRGTDLLGRFGGDEFVIILPDAGCGVAAEIAERMRQAVAGIRMDELDSSPSISIGLASVIPPTPLEDALTAADQALYRAKRAGRNRLEAV